MQQSVAMLVLKQFKIGPQGISYVVLFEPLYRVLPVFYLPKHPVNGLFLHIFCPRFSVFITCRVGELGIFLWSLTFTCWWKYFLPNEKLHGSVQTKCVAYDPIFQTFRPPRLCSYCSGYCQQP